MNGGWKMDKPVFDERGQQADTHVSFSGDTRVCPETGEHGMLYDHRMAHSWRYLDWLQLNDLSIVGFHETIQEVKNLGNNYRKFDNVLSALRFFCRKLDLHPLQS